MKTTKPRNREHRTKSAQQGNLITIHVHLPRDAYDQIAASCIELTLVKFLLLLLQE